jgi:hypothetical protein
MIEMIARGRLRIALFVFIGLIIVIASYVQFVAPYIRQKQINALLARYYKDPSDETARGLISLLDDQIATQEEGTRILEAIFIPKLTVRKSYCVGRPVYFSLKRAAFLHFRHMMVDVKETVDYGNNSYGGTGGGNNFDAKPLILSLLQVPSSAGTYQVTVRYQYKLTPEGECTSWTWPSPAPFPWNLLPISNTHSWRDKNDRPMYACDFEIPVRLNVAMEDKAETVKLVSNPDLDLEIKKVFKAQSSQWQYGYSTSDGRRECTGGIDLYYSDLPLDVAFTVSFVDGDGKEILLTTHDRQAVRGRRSTAGILKLPFDELHLEKLGAHNGVIVLNPSIESAYYDPEIREIWGGTLRFPAMITVGNGRQ